MNSTPQCSQRDMFGTPKDGFTPLTFEIKGIEVPRGKDAKPPSPNTPPNCHVPSKKNNKMWITKAHGRPLKRPFLITKPEYQEWTEKALQRLESILLSKCQTASDGIQQVQSRLCAILSLLPADDSVKDLTEGSWKVQFVNPGEEGAEVTITRLT